ncbi:hypothetical protein DXG03_007482 [Asterophora parasitica]|uniref:Uncharacterized protein n=1 Tax=Asterophora parasitica TaxID=117018 RepID=A0A9P7G4J6_9AGAR|nr:hypothetical protein DXG03_007482 [Asterophora parasitica]
MFELNPHSIDKEVPVVELSVSAIDLSFFLKALHDTSFFRQPTPSGVAAPFSIISAILRLSDKYDVPCLRRRAIEHLEVVYPTSLKGWDLSPRFESSTPFDHGVAVKLANDFNIPWIRPMAVYRLASQPFDVVLASLFRVGLCEDDMGMCIRGIRALRTLQFSCGIVTLSLPRKLMSQGALCTCQDILKAKWNAIIGGDFDDPLAVYSVKTEGFCMSCTTRITETFASRREVWDRIPTMIFNESWDTLEALRRASIDKEDVSSYM